MSSQHPYSSLESFFVFNTIKLSKTRPIPFDEISKALKENEDLVKNRPPAYLARFGPEAIKELYLALIKEEARSRVYEQDGDDELNTSGNNDGIIQRGRGGEIEDEELMDVVEIKCYIRYRDEAIASLRADEKAYFELKQRAEQQEKTQIEATKVKSPKGVPSIDNLLRHDEEAETTSNHSAGERGVKSPTIQATGLSEHKNIERASIRTDSAASDGQRIPPAGPLEPRQSLVEGRQIPNPYGQPNFPLPRPPPNESQPFLPPSQLATHGFSDVPPPLPDVHRRPSFPAPHSPPNLMSRSPGMNQVPLPPVERPLSGSPIILPPPPGMVRASSSGGPLDPVADTSSQQHRKPPTLPSSRPPQSPSQIRNSRQLPQPRKYSQQQYTYHDPPSQQSPVYPSYSQNTPRTYPPASYHPASINASGYGTQPHYTQTTPQYSYTRYGQESPHNYHAPGQPPYGQTPIPMQSAHNVPSTPIGGRSGVPNLSPIDTGGSATRWKHTNESYHDRPHTPSPPGPDAISPILAPSPSPETTRPDRQPLRRGRGRPSRLVRSTPQSDRAPSMVSAPNSTATTLARSSSVASPPGETGSIKNEPPVTPAADDQATDSSTIVRPTRTRRGTIRALEVDSSASAIRSTGGSLLKRKRGTEGPDTPTASPATPSFPNQVTAPQTFTRSSRVIGMRNFPRTSQTIMNDITSHKHAYMFQQPLSNRQAPGYKDVIYRPQDLKSIKSAITSGARALNTAANAIAERSETPVSARTVTGDHDALAGGSPAAATGTPVTSRNRGTPSFMSSTSANIVSVPVHPDIVPPKGIVNSGQFEKEVMRTFANAIMFNPDPKRGFPKSIIRRIMKGDASGAKERHVPKGLEIQRDRKGKTRKGTGERTEVEDPEEEQEENSDEEMSASESEDDVDGRSEEGWLGNERDRDVVHDTREMFEAIEQKVAQWREAERTAETRVRPRGGGDRSDDDGDDDRAGATTTQVDEESKVEAASSEVEKSAVENRGRAAKRRKR